jgi:hypothetical protein
VSDDDDDEQGSDSELGGDEDDDEDETARYERLQKEGAYDRFVSNGILHSLPMLMCTA